MSYPLDNLGDYNKVRDDLKRAGGDVKKLYKAIGDNAVKRETPGIFQKGVLVGCAGTAAVITVCVGAYQGIKYMVDRRRAVKEEEQLKVTFEKAVGNQRVGKEVAVPEEKQGVVNMEGEDLNGKE